ncbi:MAG: GGDEF domain-containing protein [Pseudomonadota bacterium]|nr:GGDEF domain-containing protein [Pseudomonadota bacterium]
MHLNQKLRAALANNQRARTAVAVMYLDIDKFKLVNDTYGHAVGDAVLIEFSRRLERCVRATDTVARLAGDEFIIVLESLTSAAQPALVARKIIAAMAAPCAVDDLALQISTSIGIAYGHTSNLTPDDMMTIADKSLYAAKSAGRNTFKIVVDRDAAEGS